MWSGPRNISTALMRSWGNRPDTVVCDEPLYAHYLKVTGREHPGADEVLASQDHDWRRVVAWLTGPIPGGKTIFYQKHMAHHLLPGMEQDWLDELCNCLLIRDPAEMLTSLVRHLPDPTLRDTGLEQQVEIFDRIRTRSGRVPPVIDARDVLEDPERILRLLCGRVEVPFDSAMLSWPPGPRETDGVWARHWYAEVWRSSGFRPYRPKNVTLAAGLRDLHAECSPLYERLAGHRLR